MQKKNKQVVTIARSVLFGMAIILSCNAFAKDKDKDKDKDNHKDKHKNFVTQSELDTAIGAIELTPGPEGPTGPQGIQGLAGINGTDGAVGATGPEGPQGPAGASGIDGAAGPQGIQGLAGTNGTDGAVGATGPEGPEGPAGANGIDGAAGPAGADGGNIQYVAANPIAINNIQRLTVDATGGTFTLGLGGQITPALLFDIVPSDLQFELQEIINIVFTLVDPDPDVKITKEGDFFHITFVGELVGQTVDLLTVDATNLTGGLGATVETGDEIGLTPGTSSGQLLAWNGSNWIATAPRSIDLPAVNNMQPYQVVNYIIALQGIFPSRNSADPFIAEIIMFGGNFAPRGWALCDGQLLPISSNTALFSLLGTTYGGDGRTTFGLPDLRGRVAVHAGNGPGLTSRRLGEKGGAETTDHPPR